MKKVCYYGYLLILTGGLRFITVIISHVINGIRFEYYGNSQITAAGVGFSMEEIIDIFNQNPWLPSRLPDSTYPPSL